MIRADTRLGASLKESLKSGMTETFDQGVL
jgi:hypothetical protein